MTVGSRDTGLFSDYQNLMRVWTHPRLLQLHTIKKVSCNAILYLCNVGIITRARIPLYIHGRPNQKHAKKIGG